MTVYQLCVTFERNTITHFCGNRTGSYKSHVSKNLPRIGHDLCVDWVDMVLHGSVTEEFRFGGKFTKYGF